MNTILKRVISLMLCFVLLAGYLPVGTLAEEIATVQEPSADTAVVVEEETADAEKAVLAAAEPVWMLPECNCGSTEAELGSHGETCARKVFLEEFCKETAADIFAKWENLPEDCQKYILEYLGKDETNAEKLAELNGYVNAVQAASDENEDNTDENEDNTNENKANTNENEGNTSENEGNTSENEGNTTETEGNTTETEDNTTEDEGNATETEGNTEEIEVAVNNNVLLFAGEPLAVVYAASDFQLKFEEKYADDVAGGKTIMKNIIDQMIKAGYTDVDGALFAGDYSNIGDTWNDDETNAVKYNDEGVKGIDAVLRDKWSLTSKLNKLSNLMTDDSNAGDKVVYIQGNHDPADTVGLDKFGANDYTHYGVFVIHEDNFQWEQRDADNDNGNSVDAEKAAQDTAAALKAYLQEKVDTKDKRPIFVASHVPLHYGYRTTAEKDGDNIYAKYLFDVLNEYGEQLNIIFLFGHNHSSTYDDYLGGAAVYLPAGDKIRIPNLGSTTNSTEYTLKFTYMNAGYLGYYGGKCETKLSSTIFAIYDDKIIVARYGETGIANLKDKGIKAANDPASVTANEKVYESGQTITLKTFKEELKSSALSSGVMTKNNSATVSVSGVLGKSYTVEWSSSNPAIAEVHASETEPMTAVVTAKSTGSVKIFAKITEVPNTRAVGDSQMLEMELEVVDVEMKTLAAKGSTIYVLDDNQDSSSWTADTSKKYVIVSQDKGNPTAGEFMAMYYDGTFDTEEGDFGAYAEQELNAEPITVMPLKINGQTQYAVTTDNSSFVWSFAKVNRSGDSENNWYVITSAKTNANSLMLSKLHATDALNFDEDGDGIRMCSKQTTFTQGYAWRMSGRGAGLTAMQYSGTYSRTNHYYAPYYDPIQGDFSVYYTQYGDENMGKRVYLYEEATVEQDILAYMKDTSGSVSRGVGPDAGTGDVIYIQNGNDTVTVPVTVGMLSKGGQAVNANTTGSHTGLTVTYAGQAITTNYTLTVTDAATLLKNEGGKFRSTIYRLVEEMVGGRHYLIVDNNEAGEAHAMGATARTSDSDNSMSVSAHNVLIQSFKIGEKTEQYINSARYSDYPDNPTSYIIKDQGNVNANIFSADHSKAVRLVWTPTKIVSYIAGAKVGEQWFTTSDITAPYWFLNAEYEKESGRLWLADNNSYKPVLFWRGSTSAEEEWTYVPTSDSNDKAVRQFEGLVLNSSGKKDISYRDGSTYYTKALFRLFYNPEVNNSSAFKNQNFIAEEMRTDLYSPLHRRTWIYEQDDSIDTITARLDDLTGRVTKGCNASAHIGDYILVETYGTDGSVEQVKVPVRVSMLSGNLDTKTANSYSGLTVTYEGKVITNNYTLIVAEPVADDYPEFPDEGAVKIDKQLDTTQYNYLDTGAAVIDLSVTGIPAQSGVDILFVLDTSSSMYDCIHNIEYGSYCDDCEATINKNTNSRLALLKKTLVNTLTQLKEPINGYTPDIEVAVACFNGYTPINGDIMLDYTKTSLGDTVSSSTQTQLSEYRIDSSNVSLNFTDVADLTAASMQAAADGLYLNAGTNYDRGLELAYDMLKEKQERDALNGETRQQILVFMSDGTPFQFNYAHGTARMNDWNNWLVGKTVDAVPSDNGAKQLFAAYRNAEGKHWMAEAIKGDPAQKYKIVNPDLQESNDKIEYVSGLGATIYTIGMGIADDLQVTAASAETILKKIASEDSLFFACMQPDDFEGKFSAIANTVRSAGDAVFTDQMGVDFDLITYNQRTFEKENGDTNTVSYNPQIILRKYPLYHRSDIGHTVDGVKVTEAMAGTRRPVAPTVIETVTFDKNGTAAYSDGDTSKNILKDGVICAKTFWYNTTQNPVQIDTNGDGKLDNKDKTLEKECFYWNVGDIPQDELVLTYPVYLTGSMEGTRVAGTYDTNEHAELNYVNYLNHSCTLEVPTPKLPWDQATVAYAFYLVDKAGNPIINQTTGATGSFERSVQITQPVYSDFLLNSTGSSIAAEVKARDVLPEGYVLFDTSATYKVSLQSNGTGYYEIGVGRADGIQTTFVQGVQPTAVKGSGRVTTGNFATANTTVWFAVTANVQCAPDTVVIDYGLPVEVDVMANDVMIGYNGTLKYVGGTSVFQNGYDAAKENDPDLKLWEYLQNVPANNSPVIDASEINGAYGKAKVMANTNGVNGKVRYALNESNGMQMKEEETFVYAVNYTGNVGTKGYYYSTVTVIPATTIYYEDEFVTLTTETKGDAGWAADNPAAWTQVGSETDATQAEDRPGEYSLSQIDANNVYGYDAAYSTMSQYSLGSAAKANVYSGHRAKATFEFYGTGFDVISLTSNKTGTIAVSAYPWDADAKAYSTEASQSYVVDTYYGYTRNDEGEWVVDNSTSDNALYQVPVMKISGLTYGKYKAEIVAAYNTMFDHDQYDNDSYDFYLDAIRIYDPADNGAGNQVIEDAYKADGEGWPTYFEVRNKIIDQATADQLGNDAAEGIVFIDGVPANKAVSDYKNFGPNNETYLAAGQAIAFELSDAAAAKIQLAVKTVGGSASVKVYSTDGDIALDKEINTATDMYYDITAMNGKTVVIMNDGESGILSITNVKITYSAAPTVATKFLLRRASVDAALATMRVEEEVPETTEPSVPETTVPETTVPEETKPDNSELKAAVEAAKQLKEKDYTKESYKAVKSALKSAEKVLKDKNATQAQIDAALEALNAAVAALEALPDASALEKAVEEARKIKQKGHTQASFQKLQTAIKAAEKVLKNKNATQAQIDKALADLNAAVDGLETVAVKPINPKPGSSGGKIQNHFKALGSIMNVFRNLLKGIKK